MDESNLSDVEKEILENGVQTLLREIRNTQKEYCEISPYIIEIIKDCEISITELTDLGRPEIQKLSWARESLLIQLAIISCVDFVIYQSGGYVMHMLYATAFSIIGAAAGVIYHHKNQSKQK